ncbi:MAG: hypothetical protein DMG38_27535 [Acidobacteria bacterium]|nr:MAG: hypothetical protein DMG38_27535 [Acidobacteriota bacterium]
MQLATPTDTRKAEIARIVQTEHDIALLQLHLQELIDGAAFKGSHRSGQFLRYVVEQAIAGHFDSLKERLIGVELFGRSPSYDTGDDAIVRVTASDVRRRLLQHYGKYGATSEFRIILTLGSYIPEIIRSPLTKLDLHEPDAGQHHESKAARQGPPTVHPAPQNLISSFDPTQESPTSRSRSGIPWLRLGFVLTALNLIVGVAMFWTAHASKSETVPAAALPWSAFFSSPNATHLITSDPNIAEIQGFTGDQISVSDYANHNYIPEPNTLTPEINRFCRVILRGDKAAAVDTVIAVNIGQIAQASSRKIKVHAARDIQLSDLKTDDNFIFLGSPRSDPWSALFSDELDFRFVFDKDSRQEIIRNVHPRQHELTSYIPTAPGWATGQSFALIAFVKNPDQNGHVLLLAGENREGTEAAGRLVTDLARLSDVLQKCGVPPSGPLRQFELLLHLNMMAGSPNNVDVVACHILSGTSAH